MLFKIVWNGETEAGLTLGGTGVCERKGKKNGFASKSVEREKKSVLPGEKSLDCKWQETVPSSGVFLPNMDSFEKKKKSAILQLNEPWKPQV